MDHVVEAFRTLSSLLWYTLWAFILGYLLSSIIQVTFSFANHTFVLNIVFGIVGIILLAIRWRAKGGQE